MIKQTAWILICLSAVLFWGNGALAQSNSDQVGIAPQQTVITKSTTIQERKTLEQTAAATGQGLHAMMEANVSNPAYNMKSAISRLQKMGYYYPLTNFDTHFPLVKLTGDKEADRMIMKEALKTWKANQAGN